jgi:hypothetical protein
VQLRELSRHANFTDRLLLTYFTGLALAIAIRRHRVPGWPSYIALHVLLVGAIAALVWWARRAGDGPTPSKRAPHIHAWYPLAVPLIAFPEAALLQDRYILAFEAAVFGAPPTVWLGQFDWWLFSELLQLGYLSYFLFLPVVAAVLYSRPDGTPFFRVMAATTLGYVICYVIFVVFPTEGPAHTLRALHSQPLPGGPLYSAVLFVQRAGTHGNAFPSAHVVGAVVPVIFAWRYVPC